MTAANPVTEMMRQRKVSPLPRNYELFYEALHGSNSRLSAELDALGAQPFQNQLDELFSKYIGQLRKNPHIEQTHGNLAAELEGLLALLSREQEALQGHGTSLAKFRQILSSNDKQSLIELGRAITDIKAMTGKTLQVNAGVLNGASQSADELVEMRKKLNEYKRLAYIDSLTGLFNRRAFDDRLGTAFTRASRHGNCALILADIDLFKQFNDSYGHPAGDKVLMAVGRTLARLAARNIFVARPGGEEFAVIVENTSPQEAERIAELARTDVENLFIDTGGNVLNMQPITISLGVSMHSEAADAAAFYRNSDLALYAAKNDGRNRVCVFDPKAQGNFSKSRMLYRDSA